jgi:hypothetical protein
MWSAFAVLGSSAMLGDVRRVRTLGCSVQIVGLPASAIAQKEDLICMPDWSGRRLGVSDAWGQAIRVGKGEYSRVCPPPAGNVASREVPVQFVTRRGGSGVGRAWEAFAGFVGEKH